MNTLRINKRGLGDSRRGSTLWLITPPGASRVHVSVSYLTTVEVQVHHLISLCGWNDVISIYPPHLPRLMQGDLVLVNYRMVFLRMVFFTSDADVKATTHLNQPEAAGTDGISSSISASLTVNMAVNDLCAGIHAAASQFRDYSSTQGLAQTTFSIRALLGHVIGLAGGYRCMSSVTVRTD